MNWENQTLSDITLVTPPSYDLVPGKPRVMVLGAGEAWDDILETFQQDWPDYPLALYRYEGEDTAWMLYHLSVAEAVLIHIGDGSPNNLAVLAGNMASRHSVFVSVGEGYDGIRTLLTEFANNPVYEDPITATKALCSKLSAKYRK